MVRGAVLMVQAIKTTISARIEIANMIFMIPEMRS
jgi:hypothetical protein